MDTDSLSPLIGFALLLFIKSAKAEVAQVAVLGFLCLVQITVDHIIQLNTLKSLRYKHSPTTIFLSTLNIFFGNQLIQKLLNRRHTDTCFLFHICKR